MPERKKRTRDARPADDARSNPRIAAALKKLESGELDSPEACRRAAEKLLKSGRMK